MTDATDTISYSMSLPIEQVRVKEGHNPRRYFNKAKHDELCESLRQNGIIHPIAVRKIDEGFEIIAGERRWRAALEIGMAEIDAKVFECSELVARRMSRVENLNRQDLSIAEEAYLAQDQVDDSEGDYDSAARALGWSLTKLHHRLRLLHASKPVMDALMKGVIFIGHAELLATLPEDQQNKTLEKVIEHKATIAQLREQLQAFSIPLEQAKFDKAGCLDCPFNSSQQSSLFAEHIDGARCTHSVCFGQKTAEWIEVRRAEVKDEYASVELRTETMPGKLIPLVMQGSTGVGREQFDACRSCAFRTCVIDNRVGTTTGNIEGPLCGDSSCNSEKVATYQASCAPQPAVAGAAGASEGGKQENPAQSQGKPSAGSATKASGKATSDTPKVAKEEYQDVLRRAAAAQVKIDPRILLSLAVYGLNKLGKGNGGLSDKDMPANVRQKYSEDDVVLGLLKLSKEELQSSLVSMSATYLGNKDGSVQSRQEINRAIVKQFGIDLAPYVQINESFLKNHTIPAIHSLLDESGFTAWHVAQPDGEKKHKALLALGKAKLIEVVLEAGFDFAGFIPSGVKSAVRGK